MVLAPGDVAGWLAAHATERVGVTVQGTWRAGTGDVRSVALAAADGTAAWLDAADVRPDDDAALAAWFADAAAPKVMHDAKGPMLALGSRGWPLAGLVSDTALAAYLVKPDQRTFDLADLTLSYLKRELKQGVDDDAALEGQGQLSFDSVALSRPR